MTKNWSFLADGKARVGNFLGIKSSNNAELEEKGLGWGGGQENRR